MKSISATLLDRADFTPEEAKILVWLCEGYTRREIANIRNRSASTVNRHIEHIAEKLDAHSHAEIVSVSVARSIVDIKVRRDYRPAIKCLLFIMVINFTQDIDLDMRTNRTINRPRTELRTARRQPEPSTLTLNNMNV